MGHRRQISMLDRELLDIIGRGHPDRTFTAMGAGLSRRVSPLKVDEIQIALNTEYSETIDSIARLVANSYIKSGRQHPSFWRWLMGERGISYFWITESGRAYLQAAQIPAASSDKIQTSGCASPEDVEKVKNFLQRLGYKITTHGVAVASMRLASGYSHCETASHLAVLTLARDAREAGDDAVKLMALIPPASAMLELLSEFKSANLIREEIFQNHGQAILSISIPNENQLDFIHKILSSSSDSRIRVANSYSE